MQRFDTSMTDTQFKTYYRNKNEELLKNDANYQEDLTTVDANINRISPNLQQAQYEVDTLNQRKSRLEYAVNQNPRFYIGISTRIRDINDNQLSPAQNKLTMLTAEMNTYTSTKQQLLLNKNKNDSDRIILIKQLFFYGNREEGCKSLSAVIDKQEALLKQYNTELTDLNKQYADCNTNYNNTCSAEDRNALTTLIAKRDEESKQLDKKYAEYDSDCKGKIKDCEPLLTVFQQKTAAYDYETKQRNNLDDEYKTCMDPKKNKCKDGYNDTIFNKSVTETSVDMLKPSTPKSSEGFTQYSSTDNADVTHAKLVANYKSVQNDYTKLKNNVQELNSVNNNVFSKTSRYAAKKQLYDNAIYTNILLTALATSVVYYIFTDL
jgi:chromosome segregation ATPase